MLTRYTSSGGRVFKQALIYTLEEHGIKRENIDPDALRIIERLNSAGFKAYLVGGAVRDLLLHKIPKDFDIVTNAEPPKIKRLFRNSRIIGKRFRLVHIIFGPKIFEVSTFRSTKDGSVGNVFGTIDEDVLRRDFTLNALYYDTAKQFIIDYVGGVKDIKKRVIRPVISKKIIFKDDPVRMLRGLKYGASSGFKIPGSLSRLIRKQAFLLEPVSPSRLTEELIKILNSGKAAPIVKACSDHDLYMYLQPSAADLMDSFKDFEKKYYDSLAELDSIVSSSFETRLGRKLTSLIDAFIDYIGLENSGDLQGLYYKVYRECRKFILPINPPRVELDYAVKFCLKKRGFKIPSKKRKAPAPEIKPKQELESSKNSLKIPQKLPAPEF